MYYYIIKSAKTGEVIAEGTAGQLSQGTGKNAPTALQLDCYELERLNWQRRQEGKPALSYGVWVSLGKPKA